ncbi:SRPBCC family protein [Luteipulveratus mongoliensis]|uniref:Polyketide cyclase n=1 Tax=Luteipulveratus mongoliensis TaxID=571913 RepID=A0A0K1JLM3_9MICO|nr:SRPBCC family protein [Luteipulveratus mongoliensis]AKU17478.1 polyketide cyclase [Luteipulveratus mongoliensis]
MPAGRTMTVSDSVVIAADPQTLYDEISDPRHMGRWSPENTGADVTWAHEGEAQVGAQFVGHNTRGRLSWETRCRVTAADRGTRFAFEVYRIGLGVPALPAKIATWSYDFEPTAEGTRVTETWTDRRTGWPDFVAARFDRAVTGGKPFAQFQEGNIATTLARLKADFESR